MKWALRAILAAALAGALFLAWTIFFPSPEKIIRQRLTELARVVSFSPNEGPIAKLDNPTRAAAFCTSDVEVAVEVPGYSHHELSGKDNLLQALMAARASLPGLQVEFFDPVIELAPNKQAAVVGLTARGKVPGDRDFQVIELKFSMKKVEREWLIRRIETVKTIR